MAAFDVHAAVYGVQRAAGALQYDRYGDRGKICGHAGAVRRLSEQPDIELCHHGMPWIFQCGAGADIAGAGGGKTKGDQRDHRHAVWHDPRHGAFPVLRYLAGTAVDHERHEYPGGILGDGGGLYDHMRRRAGLYGGLQHGVGGAAGDGGLQAAFSVHRHRLVCEPDPGYPVYGNAGVWCSGGGMGDDHRAGGVFPVLDLLSLPQQGSLWV